MSAAVDEQFVHPAFINKPPRHHSDAARIERLCARLGERVELEQALALDVLTGRNADNSPSSRTNVVICARQNLKTYDLERINLDIALNPYTGPLLMLWTSQQLDTTEETFEHFIAWFEAAEDLPTVAARLAPNGVKRARGSYQITLLVPIPRDPRGRTVRKRIKFKARSGKAGRGLTGDVVTFDEAFAVERSHLGALIPTLSTRPRALVFYGSSAGHEYSEVLADLVERGRRGGPHAPAYIEWCAPGSLKQPGCQSKDCRHLPGLEVGCALDNREFIQLANPMVGKRITWKTLDDERNDLPPAEFARERLGWHDPIVKTELPPITVDMWNAQLDDASEIPAGKPLVLAVEIATDRLSASIAAAGYREDGTVHVEVVEQDNGVDWVLPRLLELTEDHTLYDIERRSKKCAGIIIDQRSPAATLIDPLRRENIEPVIMTAGEAAIACGDMHDALKDADVWHVASPTVEAAIKGAVRRDLGDGNWCFGRAKSEIDITPAVAVTNARWGLTITEPEVDDSIAGFY